jgi:hypothetical protein
LLLPDACAKLPQYEGTRPREDWPSGQTLAVSSPSAVGSFIHHNIPPVASFS